MYNLNKEEKHVCLSWPPFEEKFPEIIIDIYWKGFNAESKICENLN